MIFVSLKGLDLIFFSDDKNHISEYSISHQMHTFYDKLVVDWI